MSCSPLHPCNPTPRSSPSFLSPSPPPWRKSPSKASPSGFTMHPDRSIFPAPCGSSGRSGRGTFRGSGSPVSAAVSTSISSPWRKRGRVRGSGSGRPFRKRSWNARGRGGGEELEGFGQGNPQGCRRGLVAYRVWEVRKFGRSVEGFGHADHMDHLVSPVL